MEKGSQKFIYRPSYTLCRSTGEESSFITVAVNGNISLIRKPNQLTIECNKPVNNKKTRENGIVDGLKY